MLFQKEIKIGELVRNRNTREVFLVVAKTTQGVFIVNLMLPNNNPALVQMILPGYTDSWDRDTDINDLEEWEAELINKKMPLIEELNGNGTNRQLFNGNDND